MVKFAARFSLLMLVPSTANIKSTYESMGRCAVRCSSSCLWRGSGLQMLLLPLPSPLRCCCRQRSPAVAANVCSQRRAGVPRSAPEAGLPRQGEKG
jgi:hypothetical protein